MQKYKNSLNMNQIPYNIYKIKPLKSSSTIRKPKIPTSIRYNCLFMQMRYYSNRKFMRRPEIVQRIAEAIKRVAPDAKTILYGSEARGDARPDSDIDLLVLLEGENRPFRTPFYFNVVNEGIVL